MQWLARGAARPDHGEQARAHRGPDLGHAPARTAAGSADAALGMSGQLSGLDGLDPTPHASHTGNSPRHDRILDHSRL